MTILKIMIKKLYKKGYKLLRASGIFLWRIREQFKKIRNNKERENDFSIYLVDMYNYSLKHMKNS